MPIRGDIEQRAQDEGPLLQARMRQNEAIGHPVLSGFRACRNCDKLMIVNEIEVKCARFPAITPLTSELGFDAVEQTKEIVRVQSRFHRHHGVDEIRLS